VKEKCIIGFLIFNFWTSNQIWATTPEQVVKKMVNAIKLKKFSKGLTEKDLEHNRQMVRIAAECFDIEAMGKATLDKHWEFIDAKKREELIDKIKDLIIKLAYPAQGDAIDDIQVIYRGQQIEEDHAKVNTLVIFKEKELRIDYLLHQKHNSWLTYDVLSNDRSLVEDYRKQFDKIITQYSIDKLFELLDKKLKAR